MALNQIRDDILRQIWIGRIQKGTKVAAVANEIDNRFVLPSFVFGRNTSSVVDKKTDVLTPQWQESLLRISAINRADRP